MVRRRHGAPLHLHLDGILEFDKRYLAEEPLDPANVFFCTSLTILMLIGLRRLWREDWRRAAFFSLVLFFFPSVFYLTHVEVYYRRQIDPLIVVLAVYGVSPMTKMPEDPLPERKPDSVPADPKLGSSAVRPQNSRIGSATTRCRSVW